MLRVLCGASVVSIVIGMIEEGVAEGWYDGAAILLAVCIIVIVTTTNNYMKEQQFRKLNSQRENRSVSVSKKFHSLSAFHAEFLGQKKGTSYPYQHLRPPRR